MTKTITIAYGDGIGPEIMEAVLLILKEAKADLNFETVEVGEKIYKKGLTSGIDDDTWDSLKRTKVILKAPITTPQGGGYKSLNVTMRKMLGLYANIRPTVAFSPYIETNHPNMNLVIVRENEEDLYAGIEYRHTRDMYESMKLISASGSEKIIRYAFEYAKKNNRKKVSCFSKDNIMKMTDGIFHKMFNKIALEYPDIKNDHHIVDIGSARIASSPEQFDVIVTSNLYGDIISDIAAEISGSVGLAGSANIGTEYALFEAIHGSAPDIAGKNIANPSGLLQGAIMMLVHIGQSKIAEKIHNAWSYTIEQGIHTPDIYNEKTSTKKVGTKEFAIAVVENLGKKPSKLPVINYPEQSEGVNNKSINFKYNQENKELVGVDIFIDSRDLDHSKLANELNGKNTKLGLQNISCKGLSVWPSTQNLIKYHSDHWRLRFISKGHPKKCTFVDIVEMLNCLNDMNLDIIKLENLFLFDDQPGFSLNQGE